MKKRCFYLFAMMVAVVLCVGFASCSSDDDEGGSGNTGSIVGTWQLVVEEEYDESGELLDSDNVKGEQIYYRFNNDMTGFEYERGRKYPFTYTLIGNILAITEEGYSADEYEIVTLTKSELAIKSEYYGGYDIERYQKVSDSSIPSNN